MAVEIIVPVTFMVGLFTTIITVSYINRTAKHKERMTLLEKGLDASMFNEQKRKRKKSSSSSLKLGMVAIAIGLGLLMGSVLDSIFGWAEAGYFSMILLFGGVGLVGHYILMEAKEEIEEKKRAKRMEDDNLV